MFIAVVFPIYDSIEREFSYTYTYIYRNVCNYTCVCVCVCVYVCMYVCMYVDALCIRRWQKIKIYQLYVCSSMSWLLGLLDLPLSWVERNIDTIITRFLKKWVGLHG